MVKIRIARFALLLVIILTTRCERVLESAFFLASGSGFTFDLYDYINIKKKITVMAWVGVNKLSSLGILRIDTKTGYIDLKAETSAGSTYIYMENTYGLSNKILIANTGVDTKNWFRFALSFEINTIVSQAYLFVEGHRTSIDNIFAGASGVTLILGSIQPGIYTVDADISFLELTYFKQYLNLSTLNETIQGLFEFEPHINILTQVYKHGPYAKRYFNHIANVLDVTSGNSRSYGLVTNIYSSLESLGSNLKLYPKANYRGNIDQSYMIVLRMDLFYHNTVVSTQNLMHRLPVHSRNTSASALIFENIFKFDYSSITIINGVNNIQFKNAVLSTSETDLYNRDCPIASIQNKLPVRLYAIKVRKTVLDASITITMLSELFGVQTAIVAGSLLDTDLIYIGSSNTYSNPKYSSTIHQMVYLKIYEITYFQNTYIDWRQTENDKIKAGISGDTLVLDCDAATEGIKRMSLTTPYNIAYNSCVPESYISTCSVANCTVCEGATCFECKVGYELDSGINTCNKCLIGNSKVYDPFLRICVPYISTLATLSGSNNYAFNIDFTTYALNYGTVQPTEVIEQRLVFRLKPNSVIEPVQYNLTIDNGTVQNYNMLQFFDNSILDEDGYVYLSFDTPDNTGPFYIHNDANFILDGFIGGQSVARSANLLRYRNFTCYRASQIPYVKASYASVTCTTACSGTKFIDSTTMCADCPTACTGCTSSTNCSGCSPGYFLVNGQCLNCSSNCTTCTDTPNNCSSCSGIMTLKIGTTNNYCTVDNPDINVVSNATTYIETNLVTVDDATEVECYEGTYYNTDSQLCENCPLGCTGCLTYNICTLCSSQSELISGRCIPQIEPDSQKAVEETEDNGTEIDYCDLQLRSKCVICTNRHFKTTSSYCESCSSHCGECLSANTCSICDSTLELVNDQCNRVADDGIVYFDNGQYLSCSTCDNCYHCSTCTHCIDTIEYQVTVDDNVMKFIFPDNVVLVDDISSRISTITSGILSEDEYLRPQTVLSNYYGTVNHFSGVETTDDNQPYDPKTIMDNEYFEILKLECNAHIKAEHVEILSDTSSILFTFTISQKSYDCFMNVRLKPSVVKTITGGTLNFRNHLLMISKEHRASEDQIMATTFATTTKVLVLTFALNSQQTLNALVFYLSSINLLNLVLLAQHDNYHRVYQIVSNFMLNFEIKIKISQDERLRQYYDERFTSKKIVTDVLEGEYFNLLDIRIFFVILTFVLRLIKRYISSDSKIVTNKYFSIFFVVLEKFSFAYVTSESFIFVFRRILLYRYLDTRYASWPYFLIDMFLIAFITYGIYKTIQIHTSVSEKFDLKHKYTELMMYYRPELKYSEFYTSLLFLRNLSLAIVVMYTRNNKAILAVLVNLLLIGFLGYTLRLVLYIKEVAMAIHIGTDIAIIFLFNAIIFYVYSSIFNVLLLFSCIGISSGFIAQELLEELKKIKCESILKYF